MKTVMKPVMKPVLGPAKNTTAVAASSTLAKPWIACGALLCALGPPQSHDGHQRRQSALPDLLAEGRRDRGLIRMQQSLGLPLREIGELLAENAAGRLTPERSNTVPAGQLKQLKERREHIAG
ncbi:MerR family transcriptional regulator [Xanthobacter autotrophicus]|uniref:hypothetical protein n=1 Tax=Xanthobacter autotrophicus TaxID=280 RepID=UPI003728438B